MLYRLHRTNEGRMLTPQVYYRELVLSKLGTLNQFGLYNPRDRSYLAKTEAVTKRQLKKYGFFETYSQEQFRYFKTYLKRVLPPEQIARLKKLS